MVNRGQKGGDYNPVTMPLTDSVRPTHCVLDTNVVLDLLHFADPAALPILHALETGSLIAWADTETLLELARVVTYPELKLDAAAAHNLLCRYTDLVCQDNSSSNTSLPRCKDPDDQKFLELAARCGASLLFSKDKALLALAHRPELTFTILSPRDILRTSLLHPSR